MPDFSYSLTCALLIKSPLLIFTLPKSSPGIRSRAAGKLLPLGQSPLVQAYELVVKGDGLFLIIIISIVTTEILINISCGAITAMLEFIIVAVLVVILTEIAMKVKRTFFVFSKPLTFKLFCGQSRVLSGSLRNPPPH
jgi:hypothetical protein